MALLSRDSIPLLSDPMSSSILSIEATKPAEAMYMKVETMMMMNAMGGRKGGNADNGMKGDGNKDISERKREERLS